MVDFARLTKDAKAVELRRKNMRRIRFGSADPALSDHCQRCGFSYGKHYVNGVCPDEWIAQGHQLSPY